jgi:predicted O-methyltransferase YrrM
VKSKNEDYHSEMDAKGFKEWFTRLLNSLEEPSVIIMDNASYHSQQGNPAPTTANKKCEIQNWLRQENIQFSGSELKVEPLQKVKRHRPEKLPILFGSISK